MVDRMSEQNLLDLLLVVAFAIAPRASNQLFLGGDRRYAAAHGLALLAVVASLLLGSGLGAVVWAAFCTYGIGLFLQRFRRELLSPIGIASGIPFAFSAISAVWFVAGANDLHLLGYPRTWASYAALHGSVLGWLFVGCTAHLARRPRARRVHLAGCLLSFVLFLCVAFGIDGVPHLKRIGVVGFSVLLPTILVRHALDMRDRGGKPFFLTLASLGGLVVSMGLALLNEYWPAFPRILLGLPTMVVVHGALNVLVVVPCFWLAVQAEGGDAGTRAADS